MSLELFLRCVRSYDLLLPPLSLDLCPGALCLGALHPGTQ